MLVSLCRPLTMATSAFLCAVKTANIVGLLGQDRQPNSIGPKAVSFLRGTGKK